MMVRREEKTILVVSVSRRRTLDSLDTGRGSESTSHYSGDLKLLIPDHKV